ncbi:MAG: hypothetical protein QOJ88_211 [Pyrinomonadaceae bacterium]|nr:hypothetical protein [Pyrinomonadaceae bacterium]
MFKRTFAVMLSALLLATTFGFHQVSGQSHIDGATEKSRAKVQSIGTGSNARVAVKLRDNTQLKGYISAADQESFTVIDNKTGTTHTISYADASSVKKAGSGISTKTWIILGVAAVGAAVTWVAVKPVLCDGGAQSRFPC